MNQRENVAAGDVKIRADCRVMPLDLSTHKLILEIEVPEFWVDGTTQEAADEWYDGNVLPIVTEEWMRSDVGLTLVSIPGEKEQNHDFEVHAVDGKIVGARIVPRAAVSQAGPA